MIGRGLRKPDNRTHGGESDKPLMAVLSATRGERRIKMEKNVARIFEDVGGYFVCSDKLDYLDARGKPYPTKAAAQRAAKEAGYTHFVGSGSYTYPKTQKL